MPDRDNPLDTWTFATDTDGDLRFNDLNTLSVTTDMSAIEQDLKVAASTVKGEDPIDEEFGLDVFEATRSVPHLKRELRRTLLYDDYRHERVRAVPNIEVYHHGDRRATVVADVLLDSGETTLLRLSIGGVL